MKYFKFKNISSLDKNIIMKKTPLFIKPELKGDKVDIPGRHGSLFFSEQSYSDIIITIDCFVKSDNLAQTARDIKAWLCDYGELSFSDDPEVFYKAKVINRFDISYLITSYAEFSVLMESEPFAYKADAEDLILTEQSIIHNIGTFESQPVITVYGEGDINVTINGQTIFLYNISNEITIDCVIQDAYYELINMNNNMQGDFPVLKPGANTISWVGSVSHILIKPNWRFL